MAGIKNGDDSTSLERTSLTRDMSTLPRAILDRSVSMGRTVLPDFLTVSRAIEAAYRSSLSLHLLDRSLLSELKGLLGLSCM